MATLSTTTATATMDPWTDEQEIALLKAVVRWKPAGMHKHFRMLAIREFMASQGVISPADEHTRIPGIWAKLGTMYDLAVLDEREDSAMNDIRDEEGRVVGEYFCVFDLPDGGEFEELKDERFLAAQQEFDGSESPEVVMSRRESTIADTDEPRSSPVSVSAGGRASVRGMRASARKGRTSKLQNEIETSRRTSKATSLADDETVEDADDDGDEVESVEPEEGSEVDEDKKGVTKKGGKGSKRGGGARGSTAKRGRKR